MSDILDICLVVSFAKFYSLVDALLDIFWQILLLNFIKFYSSHDRYYIRVFVGNFLAKLLMSILFLKILHICVLYILWTSYGLFVNVNVLLYSTNVPL